MAHPENRQWSNAEAARYLAEQRGRPYHDAALLHYARLDPATERDILEMGCADASLSVATAKHLNTVPDTNPANVVAIDNSPHMLNEAIRRINKEAAEGNHLVQQSVRVRKLDATTLDKPANLSIIQSLFPDGISVIFCIGLFFDLSLPQNQQVFRFLMSLLKVGGRIFFTAAAQPSSFCVAHATDLQLGRYLGYVNLAPPKFKQWAKDHVRQIAQGIRGHVPGRGQVHINDIMCEWAADIWDRLSMPSPSSPDAVVHVRINDYAVFDPYFRLFRPIADPPIIGADSHREFGFCAVGRLLGPARHDPAALTMMQNCLYPDHFSRLQHNISLAFDAAAAPFPGVQTILTQHATEIIGSHGIDPHANLDLSGAIVLVNIRRASGSGTSISPQGGGNGGPGGGTAVVAA